MQEYATISSSDASYPTSLKASLRKPRDLTIIGNPALLVQPAVGICGSRKAGETTLAYAYEFGRAAARAGYSVVSGYARGIDRAAHKGALEAGGSTIAVLAEGSDGFRIAPELKGLIDFDVNFAAVSPFEPSASWTMFRAMDRNAYIVGLSKGLFVIESREKGGTFEAAKACLRVGKPLWVVKFAKDSPDRSGNAKLIQLGGMPVRTMNELHSILAELPSLAVAEQVPLAL
jgi:DNA processing protein